jgi:hypothetical protein
MPSRGGQTAVEIMICVVLLGLGVMPIMNLITTTGREAGFSEAHILIQARAFGILDCQEGQGYDALLKAAPGQDTVDIPIPTSVPPPCLPKTANGATYAEKLTFHRLVPDGGMGMLEVVIDWVLGTDQGPGRTKPPHQFKAFRVLTRPDDSWLHPILLPLTRATTTVE